MFLGFRVRRGEAEGKQLPAGDQLLATTEPTHFTAAKSVVELFIIFTQSKTQVTDLD